MSSSVGTIVMVGVCVLFASIVNVVPFVMKLSMSVWVDSVVVVPSPSTRMIWAISAFSNSPAVARSNAKSKSVSNSLRLS